jgi:crossover junction endodeoxyribonuclease RuvC
MKHNLFIGIDPGKSGAIAFLDNSGEWWFIKASETVRDICDAIDDALRDGDKPFAHIEKVHSSPQMGVKSAFTFGESFGMLKALLVAKGVPFDEVRPQKWQKDMGCLTKGDKNVTKRRAQELFPDGSNQNITHANADALLIAENARRSELGNVAHDHIADVSKMVSNMNTPVRSSDRRED